MNMRVLLVTSSYKNAWPFLPELRLNLQNNGVEVDVLDVTNLLLIKDDNSVTRDLLGAKLNRLKGGHRFIRFSAKRFIKRHLGTYEAINIHNLEYFYTFLVDEFFKHTGNVSVSIWGSDFYRASEALLSSYKSLFEKLTYIGFGNIYTQRDFEIKIPGYQDKHKIASFGIGKFEKLRSLLQQKNSIKDRYNIDTNKITVVCGYNAYPAQRHLELLQQVYELPDDIKRKLVLILPLTYGGDESYKASVISSAEKSGCEVRTFAGFLNDDEILEMRILGDIVLNGQVSDSFSASLQEHVLCNAILIAGDWLPYQVLTDLGLVYFPVPLMEFASQLRNVIHDFDGYKAKVNDNSEILYRAGTWANRIQGWIDLYTARKHA